MQSISNTTTTNAPSIGTIDELGSTMKQLLSPADHELMADAQVRSLISYVEQWAETYRCGVAGGVEISIEEIEMLKKTRAELAHILSERLTLENEGGQPASKLQEERMDHVASAICHIDQVLPHAEDNTARAEPIRKQA